MTTKVMPVVVALLVLAAGAPPKEPPTEKVVIREQTFKLEIAADDASRAKGLMARKEVPQHGGMIFIFRDARYRSFWMKNCLVAIDLLFLDDRGRIVAVHRMKPEPPRRDNESEAAYERRLKRYWSRKPTQFAIELKTGSIDRLKLRVGETIWLDLPRLKKLAR